MTIIYRHLVSNVLCVTLTTLNFWFLLRKKKLIFWYS